MDEDKPLFQQIANSIADQIISGALTEGGAVPSTNALAVFHRINPATAAKGMHLLQAQGILEMRRGLGMFVMTGARSRLLAQRRESFQSAYVQPMVAEAAAIGMHPAEVVRTVQEAVADTFSSVERPVTAVPAHADAWTQAPLNSGQEATR